MGKLPSFFEFRSAKDLIRLGRDFDGGYLVSASDVEKAECLLSFGLGDDWSFEIDFLKKKKINLEIFDASVSKKRFLINIIKSLIKFNWRNFVQNIKIYFNYLIFISKPNVKHIKKFVGLGTDVNNLDYYIPLYSILEKINLNNIFLKIDIEGSEYRILNDIVKYKNKICGLVIEFHDSDLHLEKIKKFINDIEIKIVHIHANNNSIENFSSNLPLVLELSFSKYAELENNALLPHYLDCPNNKNYSENKLFIED